MGTTREVHTVDRRAGVKVADEPANAPHWEAMLERCRTAAELISALHRAMAFKGFQEWFVTRYLEARIEGRGTVGPARDWPPRKRWDYWDDWGLILPPGRRLERGRTGLAPEGETAREVRDDRGAEPTDRRQSRSKCGRSA
jgi:hypothetical protein